MRLLVLVIALIAVPSFAHQIGQPHGAKQATPSVGKVPPGQPNTSMQHADPVSSRLQRTNNLHSEEQRFCVKNSIGKVNCIVFPGGGH
jgi:hypothetical protein